jgi:hypothetical protein
VLGRDEGTFAGTRFTFDFAQCRLSQAQNDDLSVVAWRGDLGNSVSGTSADADFIPTGNDTDFYGDTGLSMWRREVVGGRARYGP